VVPDAACVVIALALSFKNRKGIAVGPNNCTNKDANIHKTVLQGTMLSEPKDNTDLCG
jgi:hypothetical protein